MVTVNLLSEPAWCPACGSTDVVPYDQPELIGTRGTHDGVNWSMEDEPGRNMVLTNGNYLCPACQGLSLRFEVGSIHC